MFRILITVMRMAAVVSGIVKGSVAIAALLGFSGTAFAVSSNLLGDLIDSTPLTVITCLVLGQWIGEAADAAFYHREGGEGPMAKWLLVQRLRFTAGIAKRPFWYLNEDRIKREFERTNRALTLSRFPPLEWFHSEDEKAATREIDYLRACIALVKALGVRKAAVLAPAVRRRNFKVEATSD